MLLARVPLAIVVGAAVSVIAETLQTGMPVRVASWTDVMLNAMGAAIGAATAAATAATIIFFFMKDLPLKYRLRKNMLCRQNNS